jgi:hypothetical protein
VARTPRSKLGLAFRDAFAAIPGRRDEVYLKHGFPILFPNRQYLLAGFRIMRAARVGVFADLPDDQDTSAPDATGAIRR